MGITEIREEIARVDMEILELIRKRQSLAGMMAQEKIKAGRPPVDPDQRGQVIARAVDVAVEAGIDPSGIKEIFTRLVLMSEQKQSGCMGDGNLP
ncbi:chorismate mutase [Methanocalculus alkaliphilus]|uniref:chorismate mutase n=2 Tax=Methanocalculus alkaliphilus TaxID=768730 RepID=UPI00209D32A8|nr:chorismate mutase [Methanocalculus alkaliphilus]MCP1715927.1 chorismate mutase [Methanocalculus alkaliphilus]